MNEIIKTIFKMILTGVLAILFNDILIMLLVATGIISYETWQNTPFLHFIYSVSPAADGDYDVVSLHATWDNLVGAIFASIPLILFFIKKNKTNK
jgi:hypothetical protein